MNEQKASKEAEKQRRRGKKVNRDQKATTVTLSEATQLLNISEDRLLEWGKLGLIRPPRLTPNSEPEYDITELERLVTIQGIIESGYDPFGSLPNLKGLSTLSSSDRTRPIDATKHCLYEVVFSYAGEDRECVRTIANMLVDNGVQVFFDEYEKPVLWGTELYTHLTDIYQNKGRYCIVFISRHYASKVWTKVELQAAQARAVREKREYILPIRLDETEIPGILHTVSYLNGAQETPQCIVDQIMQKLGKSSIDPIKEQFWYFYASQILRLLLLLICESVPGTSVGLVLPAENNVALSEFIYPQDLSLIGSALIAWLGDTRYTYYRYSDSARSFSMFLDPAPAFEYPSDYRIEPLHAMENGITPDRERENKVLIIVERKSRQLTLSPSTVETIERLLIPIYEEVQNWQLYFSRRSRQTSYPTIGSGYNVIDYRLDAEANLQTMLFEMVNMIVRLGRQTAKNESSWAFCYIMLPVDTALPLPQQKLEIRAKSENAPYAGAKAPWLVDEIDSGLSVKAYRNGQILYLSQITAEDPLLNQRERSEAMRSAIAIPVAGKDGLPVAVLFVASNEVNAFSKADQRVLRFVSKILDELFTLFHVHQQEEENLERLIGRPEIADSSFDQFLSESEFIIEVEDLLTKQQMAGQLAQKEVSFIVVGIDNQSALAVRYGALVARNLCRAIGMRILNQLRILSNPDFWKLYHVGIDRYYLRLVGASLNDARNLAVQLHNLLPGDYRISDARGVRKGRPLRGEEPLELHDVTVSLGIVSYSSLKLQEVLERFNAETAVANTRTLLLRSLEISLEIGQYEGGNVVVSWDPSVGGFRHWPKDQHTS